MKHLRHALALAALLTLPGLAVAAPQASTGQKAATTKHAMAATHATKGTVTAIDASTLVIARSPKSKHGMTFALEPSTTRQGESHGRFDGRRALSHRGAQEDRNRRSASRPRNTA